MRRIGGAEAAEFGQVALDRPGQEAAGVGLVGQFPLVVALAEVFEQFTHPQEFEFAIHGRPPTDISMKDNTSS